MSKKRKRDFSPPPPPPSNEGGGGWGDKVIGDAGEVTYLFPEKKTYHSTWSSPEAFANRIERSNRSSAWEQAGWENDHGENWYGTKSMEEALQIGREGWREGRELVEKVRGYIQAQFPLRKEPIKYAVAGSTPNVPRAISGNPLNMRAYDAARSKKRPIITLLASMSASCMVSKDTISNRAAAVAALIDRIEAAGFTCEVISTAMVENGNFSAATSIVVKKAGQPMDIGRLAFGLGHVSMFRRLCFADWGLSNECAALGGYLGYVSTVNPSKDLADRAIYVVPSAQYVQQKFKDPKVTAEEGVPYLINYLRAQDCPAFPKMDKDEKEKFIKSRRGLDAE